uniref:Fanconi-associated nuclease n=1 Tax=Panagrellus redivivus TaxID=6233 RepID=A0A7E4VVI5_PANRE
MLADAFKRASSGKKCANCGVIVSFAFVKRHEQTCLKSATSTPRRKSAVVVDDDEIICDDPPPKADLAEETPVRRQSTRSVTAVSSDIEVIEFVPETPASSSRPSKRALPVAEVVDDDEIVVLSDSEEPPKRNPRHSSPPPSAKLPKPAFESPKPGKSFPKTTLIKSPRSKVFAVNPSADLSIEEVYTKVFEHLENLRIAGRGAGRLLATETKNRLSQSPAKRKLDFASSDETAKESNAGEENVDIDQTDPKYGTPYVVRFFWVILARVLGRGSGLEAETFWGDTLRRVYWLTTMGDAEQHFFIRACLRKPQWLTLEDLSKWDTSNTAVIDIATNLVNANFFEHSVGSSSSMTLAEALTKLQRPHLIALARTYGIKVAEKRESEGQRAYITNKVLEAAGGKCVFGTPLYPKVLENAKKHLGPCYRIRDEALDLFNAILTVYCPSSMDAIRLFDPMFKSGLARALMYQMLLMEQKKLTYVAPEIDACIHNFDSSEALMKYIAAKRDETAMCDAMLSKDYELMYNIGSSIYLKVKQILEADDPMITHAASLPQYLRRYTEPWVLVRCCMHSIDVMERIRKYDEAVEVIQFLLDSEKLKLFLADRRGHLYERLALDLHSHLKRKADSLAACVRGIEDPMVRDRARLLLQDRALKLDKNHVVTLKVNEPTVLSIQGHIVEKNLGDARVNRFYIETNGEVEIVNVEELALRHFRKEKNFHGGMHTEGGIWHTVFGIVCFDIVFDPELEGVWLSPVLDGPNDLDTEDFYPRRQAKFESRFEEISKGYTNVEGIIEMNYRQNKGKEASGVDWSAFPSFNDLMAFIRCLKPLQLAQIFRRIAEDHRHNRSGFPDLTLWDAPARRIAVIEVKGPNDKLSTKQRLWLDFFTTAGIEAAVCMVFAVKKRRDLQSRTQQAL